MCGTAFIIFHLMLPLPARCLQYPHNTYVLYVAGSAALNEKYHRYINT